MQVSTFKRVCNNQHVVYKMADVNGDRASLFVRAQHACRPRRDDAHLRASPCVCVELVGLQLVHEHPVGGAMTRTSSANRRRGGSVTAAVQRHAQRAAACEHCARKWPPRQHSAHHTPEARQSGRRPCGAPLGRSVGRRPASVAALATQALAAMTSTVLPLKELEEITKTWKSGGDKRM